MICTTAEKIEGGALEAAQQGEHAPLGERVGVSSFGSLIDESELPLAVDTYLRGFVWNDERIEQLVDDLAEYERTPDPMPPYYIVSQTSDENKDLQVSSTSSVEGM